jgi:hypothetical protein
MMQKLTYKAQLSQNRLLTGAATPCLPTIPAEGKVQTFLFSSITCITDLCDADWSNQVSINMVTEQPSSLYDANYSDTLTPLLQQGDWG